MAADTRIEDVKNLLDQINADDVAEDAAYQATIDDLQTQVASLTASLDTANASLATVTAERDEAQGLLAAQESRIAALDARVSALEAVQTPDQIAMQVEERTVYTTVVPMQKPYRQLIAPQKSASIRVMATENGYTLAASGFPGGYQPLVNWWGIPTFAPRYNLGLFWNPSNAQVGEHDVTVATVGRSGGEQSVGITFESYKKSDASTLINFFPHVYSGKINGFYNRDSGIKHSVVSGSAVSIGVIKSDDYGQAWLAGDNPSATPPLDAKWRLVLVSSNGTHTSLSGPMSGTDRIELDSTSLVDGQYVVAIEFLDGIDLYLYHGWNLILTVANNGPVVGPQWLAATGTRGTYCGWNLPGGRYGVDWVESSGVPLLPSSPYPAQVVPPPSTLTERTALIQTANWTVEPAMKNYSYREEVDRFTVLTPGGHRYIDGKMKKGSTYYDGASGAFGYVVGQNLIGWDGPRNNNQVADTSLYCPDLDNSDFVGVEPSGRVFRLSRDGTVTTIFGPSRKNDSIHYHTMDASPEQLASQLGASVGTADVPLNEPWDLAFNPLNHSELFICDMMNHRIAKIDFSVDPPELTTFAGAAGTAGFVNNSDPLQARFNKPISLCFSDDGTLYVCDRGNFAVRKIATDGTVTTVVGQGPSSVASKNVVQSQIVAAGGKDAFLPASVGFASNPLLYYPSTIRLDSQGRLIVAEFIPSIRAIDLVNERIDKCFIVAPNGYPDFWMDVDRNGNAGPVDDVFTAEQQVGGNFMRNAIDGSRESSMNNALFVLNGLPGQTAGTYNSQYGAYGSHALCFAVAIDDDSSAVCCVSQHRLAPAIIRPKLAGDVATADIDFGAWTYGQVVAACGTAMSLAFDGILGDAYNSCSTTPKSLRPSFGNIYGQSGHAFVANNTCYDYLAAMPDVELAQYLMAGAAGSTARPELTGKDLAYLIYHIKAFSVAGRFTNSKPSLSGIVANLQSAGLHDSADTSPPVISNVTIASPTATSRLVTWNTNEPAIGIVEWGRKRILGQYSPIESAYATSHSVLIDNLTSGATYYIRIRQKDLAGNRAISSEFTS